MRRGRTTAIRSSELSALRIFTAVCAAPSWSDFMITSWPAFGSAFAFSLSSTPSRVASLVIAGLRSSVTSPFAVEMFPFLPRSLPSSTFTTPAWARLLRFSQSVCTLGRCSSLSAAAGTTVFWSAAASAGAAPCALRRQPLAQLGFHVDPLEECRR